MEFLTSESLCSKLRMPASSRLQKVHNVDLALEALKQSSAGPAKDITSRNIVDGHMEKTLGLMWHIIFGFQLDKILNEERLAKEIQHLEKSLMYRVQIGEAEAKAGFAFTLEAKQRDLKDNVFGSEGDDWSSSQKIKLLLQWARLVCAHYGIEVGTKPIKMLAMINCDLFLRLKI